MLVEIRDFEEIGYRPRGSSPGPQLDEDSLRGPENDVERLIWTASNLLASREPPRVLFLVQQAI